MGKLKNDLPKIIGSALQKEDEIIKDLVVLLLESVIRNQNKTNKEAIIKKILDDELSKLITKGIVDETVLEDY